MIKHKVNIIIDDVDEVEPVTEMSLCDVEIVESHSPLKIEIYMLDAQGNRLEGGQFDRQAFIDHVLKFYNANY